MKITQSDVDDIMKSIRATGAEHDALTPSVLELIAKLNALVTASKYWSELSGAIAATMMAHSIQSGKTDIMSLTGNSAQMGLMTGCLLGFQLGLREAGLEMGIASAFGVSGDVPDKK